MLSYLRRHTPFAVLAALGDCGLPVRVYGLGTRAPIGSLSFHEVDDRRFVDDLVACRALIAAAGNQLIGEALHLGKPLLMLPEAARVEQWIHARFLAETGCGDSCPLEHVSVDRVAAFVAGLDTFAQAASGVKGRMDGAGDVLAVIGRRLASAAAAQPSR